MWTIVASIVATLVAVVLLINFRTPEKKIQHQVRHLYPIVHPQFEREMGTPLFRRETPSPPYHEDPIANSIGW